VDRFAPVQHPRSRHLDTPAHKNSLAVSEKNPSRQFVNKKALHRLTSFPRSYLKSVQQQCASLHKKMCYLAHVPRFAAA
jgi:hypothetical protein